MALPKELRDKVAQLIADELTNLIPTAFLVRIQEMAPLVMCLDYLESGDPLSDRQRMHIHDVIKTLWHECKAISGEDMDRIIAGLHHVEETEKAAEEAKTATKQ